MSEKEDKKKEKEEVQKIQVVRLVYKTPTGALKEAFFTGEVQVSNLEFVKMVTCEFMITNMPEDTHFSKPEPPKDK